eukprot:149119-Pelagomonas_calceolata.AAC.1
MASPRSLHLCTLCAGGGAAAWADRPSSKQADRPSVLKRQSSSLQRRDHAGPGGGGILKHQSSSMKRRGSAEGEGIAGDAARDDAGADGRGLKHQTSSTRRRNADAGGAADPAADAGRASGGRTGSFKRQSSSMRRRAAGAGGEDENDGADTAQLPPRPRPTGDASPMDVHGHPAFSPISDVTASGRDSNASSRSTISSTGDRPGSDAGMGVAAAAAAVPSVAVTSSLLPPS